MKNSFCSGSSGSSSNSPNELAPEFLASAFSLLFSPCFPLYVCVCVSFSRCLCVCVFVCSCLEDMHKNALHFRFSLMRVCWWALFSALVFRKQWFPICPPPHQLFYPNPPHPLETFSHSDSQSTIFPHSVHPFGAAKVELLRVYFMLWAKFRCIF